MNKFILIDSCFWMALYDIRDQHHYNASKIVDKLEGNNIIIPWPTLYETVNTRFCKNRSSLAGFYSFIKKRNTTLIDDTEYRKDNLVNICENNLRALSLVDGIIRAMLSDSNLRIDYLITFNTKDFIDICNYRKIEILNC